MCPPGLPPQRVIAFLPSSLAGQLSRLSTGLQAPASPTSLLTTGVGVMLTPLLVSDFLEARGEGCVHSRCPRPVSPLCLHVSLLAVFSSAVAIPPHPGCLPSIPGRGMLCWSLSHCCPVLLPSQTTC